MLASGSDPTWDLSAMFGLHNVPSAHSFPFVKQDRSTCRRYMRTVYCQNGEQVSRTVLTLRFQLVCRGPPGSWHGSRLGSDRSGCPTTRRVLAGPPGSWHAAVCARAILAYLQVAAWNHEDWEEVYTASVSHRRLQRMRGEWRGTVCENV